MSDPDRELECLLAAAAGVDLIDPDMLPQPPRLREHEIRLPPVPIEERQCPRCGCVWWER